MVIFFFLYQQQGRFRQQLAEPASNNIFQEDITMLQTTITKEKTKEKACHPLFDVRQASYEHWLSCRRQYITGTDAGTIAGVNKYQTPYQLYMEKKGLVKREPANSAMVWGRRLEPVIRQAYAEESGLEVKEISYMLVSTKYPWMAGNLDGAVRLPSGEWAVLEIKNLGQHTGSTEYANGLTGFVSPSHMAQLYHYMSLVSCRKSVLCCLLSGQTLVQQIIEYDDETANALIALEKNFYFNNLKRNIAPSVSGMDNDILAQLYPKAEPQEITLPESASRLISDYLTASNEIKRWQEQKDLAEAQIKELMGSNASAVCGDKRIRWAQVTSKRLCSSKIKEIVPAEKISLCYQESTYRKFGITTIKNK